MSCTSSSSVVNGLARLDRGWHHDSQLSRAEPRPRSLFGYEPERRQGHPRKRTSQYASASTIKRLELQGSMLHHPELKPRRITLADGSPNQTIGTTRFPLFLLSRSPTIKLNVKAAVLSTRTAETILGMDVLQTYNTAIDFQTNSQKSAGRKTQIYFLNSIDKQYNTSNIDVDPDVILVQLLQKYPLIQGSETHIGLLKDAEYQIQFLPQATYNENKKF
ncbi:hypothetical protein ROZALSC1DRAFT_23936 [Rozella allomycis CSF55]|uniref:Uncharacterized protein n=1 Tax=Rozella allomycis (strain CSF55) TaxID=988480 RepID=A0A4V1IZD8_ROZAC|nr:hypothetical protein ROZALSC1DRAFT_23936 [Rozella allomycis CSF55]